MMDEPKELNLSFNDDMGDDVKIRIHHHEDSIRIELHSSWGGNICVTTLLPFEVILKIQESYNEHVKYIGTLYDLEA